MCIVAAVCGFGPGSCRTFFLCMDPLTNCGGPGSKLRVPPVAPPPPPPFGLHGLAATTWVPMCAQWGGIAAQVQKFHDTIPPKGSGRGEGRMQGRLLFPAALSDDKDAGSASSQLAHSNIFSCGRRAQASATVSGSPMHQRRIVPLGTPGIFCVVIPTRRPLSASRDSLIIKDVCIESFPCSLVMTSHPV